MSQRKKGAKPTRAEIVDLIFDESVKGLQEDMPLLMHGSGDVHTSQVDPASAKLLSTLTLNYISNLVDAAVEAHTILNGRPTDLPPPPLTRKRGASKPASYVPKAAGGKPAGSSSKRKRASDEYFDDPLPEPKIKNKPLRSVEKAAVLYEGVDIDEWVGVSGVDFWEESRVRKAHLAGPQAIGSQCFIFPICHDNALYGKVCEIQKARRSIEPILMDKLVAKMIREEGALQGPSSFGKKDKSKRSEDAAAAGATGSDSDEEEGAQWPGIDELIPVYKAFDTIGPS